jgi:hypothetical protein
LQTPPGTEAFNGGRDAARQAGSTGLKRAAQMGQRVERPALLARPAWREQSQRERSGLWEGGADDGGDGLGRSDEMRCGVWTANPMAQI